MDEQKRTTRKIKAISTLTEKETARIQYEQARAKMIKEPTRENVDAFTKANAHLFEVEDAYRIGARLLVERAVRLKNAVRGLLKR